MPVAAISANESDLEPAAIPSDPSTALRTAAEIGSLPVCEHRLTNKLTSSRATPRAELP